MYSFDTFNIAEFELEDAVSLHQFMVANKTQFGKYLPVTLGQNKSLEASKAYIILKKNEFTPPNLAPIDMELYEHSL